MTIFTVKRKLIVLIKAMHWNSFPCKQTSVHWHGHTFICHIVKHYKYIETDAVEKNNSDENRQVSSMQYRLTRGFKNELQGIASR